MSAVLTGRRAIITGASRGLGAAIADAFARAGASLMLCARSGEELAQAAASLRARYKDVQVEIHVADVSCREDVDAVFDATLGAFGGLEILVNNAGVQGPIGTLDTLDLAAWAHSVAINLFGPVYAAKRAIAMFEPARRGKIINLSGGGATAPQPGLTAYGASKAGLVRFTETLAQEVRERGIDVNAVAPGALVTRMTRELAEAGAERIGAAYHSRVSAMLEAGGRAPEKAAALCVYLASRESDGVTGRLLAAEWDPWPFTETHKAEISAGDIYTLRRIVPGDRNKTWGG